jgi:magnesium transporter
MANALDHLERRILRASPTASVVSVRRQLMAEPQELLNAVYLVDESQKLCGIVPLSDLLSAPEQIPVEELATSRPMVVAHPDDDEERVATIAFESGAAAVPVVDQDDRLLGVVPAQALIAILRHEHVEDMRRMAGVLAQDRRSLRALEERPWHRLQHRLPWLLVGLAGSAVATYIMLRFEVLLNENVKVAFFVPALVDLADAIGTQTEAAAVRLLSFGQPRLGQLVMGELLTGLLIGFSLGSAAFPAIAVFLRDVQLAFAICLSLAISAAIASTTAIVLPWLLWRAGRDPALGSGPLGTIIQDVLSLVIYLAIVTVVLS